ncbi:borealin-like isoform X2 [Armigeres subalbatus]|uniref:borealin-like isoform X2 n=1 Tax=Armigeres subalbatus TaxID=124917 RepID=UPI002ED5F12A
MTRTKTRRLVSQKRGSADERTRIENKMRDFEVNVECELANLELKFRDEMDRVQRLVDGLKTRIPKKFLCMTIDQIREYNEEADKIDASFYGDRTAALANLSIMLEKSVRKKSKDDEESENDRLSTMSSTSKRMGPLMSAKFRRRSKSTGAVNTSTASKTLFHSTSMVDRSVLGKTLGSSMTVKDRMSRAKIRTPMTNARKAISVDRIYSAITPKVQPNAALALIRHARLGEPVYSITGSPVITSNILEATANVNIPIANGMLSIRPTEMDSVDPTLVRKIDPNVLSELKQLQDNLNVIMRSLKL